MIYLGITGLITGTILISWIIYSCRRRKKLINGGEKIVTPKNLKYTQDGKINEQYLSEKIADLEGKIKQVDIGQIKEILKITLDLLANDYSKDEVLELLDKHK